MKEKLKKRTMMRVEESWEMEAIASPEGSKDNP